VTLTACRALALFIGVGSAASGAALTSNAVPHEVLAFYYTWYGPVGEDGNGRHWKAVKPESHDIADARHYPAQGPYSSAEPAVISRHVEQAQSHGVTGFISSWWGQGTYEDKVVSPLLKLAAKAGFKVSVYWETAPGKGKDQVDQAVKDLVFLLGGYATNKAFLKVDGKPVIFVYGRVIGQVPLNSWPGIIRAARAEAGEFLLIADGYREELARTFDGLHEYNPCGAVASKSPDDLRAWAAGHYGDAVKLARQRGRISCVTVIPGYDDTKIRKPGLDADRLDGEVYRVLWDEAIKAAPDWVLITSWNEWHEGSEIEPSFEYGNKYLDLTGEYARPFRGLAR